MKEFINAIFCAPTGAYDELPYPSRLTDDVFLAIKEAGINRIFGFGYDIREETQLKTLALCEKYGIKYLPTMRSFGEYVDFGWKDLSEERKIELDRRFIVDVKKYAGQMAFAGVFFGRHRGITRVSPNKSLEGYIGGFLTGIIAALVYGLIVRAASGMQVHFLPLVLCGLFGAAATELGDLSFSLIKRQYGVKDYGHLLPGHGGMLDRFDSMIFCAPVVMFIVMLLPVF